MPIVSIQKAVSTTIEEITKRQEDSQGEGFTVIGISTGLDTLDELIGGFRRNALYILGGRTGMGKTALSLGIARHVAENSNAVLYLSLEMDAELLAMRMLSGLTGYPALDIEKGRLTSKQLYDVQQQERVLEGVRLWIDDDTYTSFQMQSRTKEFQEKYGLDLLIVDYLSLLTDPGDAEVQRLEGIVGRTRAHATTLDAAILGVVQLNREVENQEGNIPTLRNIRYSDRIGHDASAAIFVHRPYYYAQRREGLPDVQCEDDALIILDKNRHGPTGQLRAKFYPNQMRWEQKRSEPQSPPRSNAAPTRATSNPTGKDAAVRGAPAKDRSRIQKELGQGTSRVGDDRTPEPAPSLVETIMETTKHGPLAQKVRDKTTW